MYQTIAVAVIVLMAGAFLKKRISFLQKFCIPAPVIGGLLFAILTLVLYMTGVAVIDFDDTLKEVCMVFFFTSVGFQANLKVLKSGGKSLIVFLFLVIMLIVMQNFSAIGLANLIGLDSLTGMTTGSIPMVGGHGTAGAFGPVLEDFGVQGATTVCTAAATFGLIAGSLMGGPVGNRLIKKHNLIATIKTEDDSLLVEEEEKHERHFSMYAPAVFQLIIAVGLGTVVSDLLSLTGMTFPIYIGAMIVAAIMRNIGEYTGKITIHMGEINDLGGICLSLFLGIAMITLKLWQLADLALPLIILLAGQVVLMFCCVQHYGQRLRCRCSCGRYLRLWYGCNTKCNGKYAGNLRKIRTVRKGLSYCSDCRQFVCRLPEQSDDNILYKLHLESEAGIMKDRKFTFDSENLAFPEIHTGKVKQNDVAEDNTDSTVVYDTVAVPEVHLKKHKHKKQKKDNK
jgi:ESS family glutamate:Na+ symporter